MNVLSSPLMRSGNALEHSLTGMQRSKDQFHEAAVETINSFAAQANALSNGDTALSSEAFVSAISSSPEVGIVNMIQSQRAFEANVKVFQAADEVEQSAIDMIS